MLLMQGKEWPAYNLCSDKAGFITGENICIDGVRPQNFRLLILKNRKMGNSFRNPFKLRIK